MTRSDTEYVQCPAQALTAKQVRRCGRCQVRILSGGRIHDRADRPTSALCTVHPYARYVYVKPMPPGHRSYLQIESRLEASQEVLRSCGTFLGEVREIVSDRLFDPSSTILPRYPRLSIFHAMFLYIFVHAVTPSLRDIVLLPLDNRKSG